MRSGTIIVAVVLAVMTLLALRILVPGESTRPRALAYTPAEEEPVCPWRDPETDLRLFFPGATGHHLEAKSLSAMRPQLTRILGRQPTGADHLLRVHRITEDTNPVGSVLVKRVKGEHGAIELVIALSADRIVRGVRAQRSREPENISAALATNGWIRAFAGKSLTNELRPGHDLPAPPAKARATAQAIAEGVRVSLASFALADAKDSAHPVH
jgi:hypothetical protein